MKPLVILTMLDAGVLVTQPALGRGSADPGEALSFSTVAMLLVGLSGIAIFGNRHAPPRAMPVATLPIPRPAMVRAPAAILLGLLLLVPWSAMALPITSLVISEVMFNPTGGDDQREWVELYNGTGSAIDLSGYSLGWGGGDYTSSTLQLSGTIAAGATYLVGGPLADAGNGNPTYDLAVDFAADLQNGGILADAVALFDVAAVSITPATLPMDAVIYGLFNFSGLIDETGSPGAVDYFGFGAAGSSIELTDTGWIGQAAPTPGVVPLATPEPGTATAMGLGLAILASWRRRARG